MIEQNNEKIRLQKFLSQAGIASRRKAEEMIKAGEIKVNGEIVKEMGVLVDHKDKIYIDGKPIFVSSKKIYILLNKPRGYVTTLSDDKSRKTVLELINLKERVFPVGRLDYHTSGLLILTNDGDFAFKMTHPSHQIPKTYVVTVKGVPEKSAINRLEKGIVIDHKKTAPSKVRIIETKEGKSLVEIIIKEGKNRQVRKMFEAVGFLIHKLKRIKIGQLTAGTLQSGQWRYLTETEISMLLKK